MPVVGKIDVVDLAAASATSIQSSCTSTNALANNKEMNVNDLDSASGFSQSSTTCENTLSSGLNLLNLKGTHGNPADQKSTDTAATTVPKSASNPPIEDNRKYFPTPANVRELETASQTPAGTSSELKTSDEPSTKPKNSEEAATSAAAKKKPFLCEAFLRDNCDNNCEYFHVETAFVPDFFPDVDASSSHLQDHDSVPMNFLWQYRVPPEVLSSQTGLEYILKLEEDSLTDDGWLSFEWAETEALEMAFIDPSQDAYIFQGNSMEYPFTGLVEIRFENSSPSAVDSHFKMNTRLKRVNDSTDNLCSTTASLLQTTKQFELSVRSLRAPSRCAMDFKCTRATSWFWWIDDQSHHFGEQSDAQWIDSSRLFGDHVHEVESAYLNGKQQYSFKAKLPNKSGAPQNFTFNFESMLLADEDGDGGYFELRRRPAPLPLVSRPSWL